jgi:hypothetical protein
VHRSYSLSKRHYASGWQVRDIDDRNDRGKVNKVAYEFATTKDPARREELQMWLLECFHSYLLKYLNMIIFGQLPAMKSPQGKDAQTFLKLLVNAKQKHPGAFEAMRDTCKTLHLAFKEQATTDEVYDVLVLLFLRVCAHYDPLYPKKTEKVCKFIESKPADSILRVEDIASTVGFDPSGCIRILVRGGYLASVPGPRKSTLGYRRGPKWPAPEKLFQITSMGFVGFAQRFFRWYLRNYIVERMGELESTEHVLQLDHIPVNSSGMDEDDGPGAADRSIPHAEGSWTDVRGTRWAADTELMERWKTLDVSRMDADWVKHTDDFLFRTLTPEERYLLLLVFVKEANWTEIGEILQCDPDVASRDFKQIMAFLEGRSKVRSIVPRATN